MATDAAGIKKVLRQHRLIDKQGKLVDKKLLAILACPLCKGELKYDADKKELICKADGMAFPIIDEIPVMLESQARTLTHDERLEKSR